MTNPESLLDQARSEYGGKDRDELLVELLLAEREIAALKGANPGLVVEPNKAVQVSPEKAASDLRAFIDSAQHWMEWPREANMGEVLTNALAALERAAEPTLPDGFTRYVDAAMSADPANYRRAAEPPAQRKRCPLCGKTEPHTHTAGPTGMT
jgi:hypothetical protein